MATKTIGQLTQATTINNVDEFAIEQSGVTKRIAASVVRGDIVNANIKSDAAIAYSKLAPLNSAQILVGNGSNVPTAVSVTGDVTISNAGVTAIGSAKVLPAMLSQPYTLATAQNSTSGTSIDFTGIPSWAKRITVMLDGVSTNGSSEVLIQIGDSGGIETTGYSGGLTFISGTNACGTLASTSGCIIGGGSAGNTRVGCMSISKVSGNKYVFWGTNFNTDQNAAAFSTSIKTLSDILDRVRVTTVNGTDTFDAGSINIAYEG